MTWSRLTSRGGGKAGRLGLSKCMGGFQAGNQQQSRGSSCLLMSMVSGDKSILKLVTLSYLWPLAAVGPFTASIEVQCGSSPG